ncbi:MAG: peptide deformylase [Clostridiales bacterium]|mgnify:FL=1|jgi:peptide deformylase|nr:peptide deformylase [Clostridiales bacterium]
MAIRNIREIGDSVLTKVSREIKEVDKRLLVLIDDMLDTLYDAEGVGLAAPQIGVLKRLVVIDVSEEGNDPIILINPEIIATDGCQIGDEGCLSVPGKVGTVERPNYVKVKAYDKNMKEFTIEGTELLARALCHEIDHLNGVLYVDKVTDELRDVVYLEEEDEE